MNMDRRGFMGAGAALFASAGLRSFGADNKVDTPKDESGKVIQGFNETNAGALSDLEWKPFSDKKVRVGIAGEGWCKFGSQFGYQSHPNVEVVACTDLDPARCKKLQERVKAPKTYPSCEEMIKHAAEDKLEAVYIATDARSHIQLAIMALEHGLNVTTAVPAFYGKDQLEFIPKLIDAEKRSGKLYMMNETSAFRPECYAMRKLYEDGFFGRLSYIEGEYIHNPHEPIVAGKPAVVNRNAVSYNGWRYGMPPMYYPTHATAFYCCVTRKRFVSVSGSGVPCEGYAYNPPSNNEHNNPFRSEVSMMKCEDGASARMGVFWDLYRAKTVGGGEMGRIWGTHGSYLSGVGKSSYAGAFEKQVVANANRYRKPPLPPGMPAGGHGGSHGYLTDDFIRGILVPGHKVCVDSKTALDMTIAGVYAHMSAMKDGEILKIPAVC